MIAQTLLRSTDLSMAYIPCCAFVLMKHNNQIKNIKRLSMSKEQTPITAREFIPKNDNGLYSRRQVEKHAEEYAQAKVLEALEREVIKARVYKDIAIKEKVLKHIVSEEVLDKYISDAQKYYETEVKPKYE